VQPREKTTFKPGVTSGSVIICGSGDCGQIGLGKNKTDFNVPAHLSLFDRKSIVKVSPPPLPRARAWGTQCG
jgi:alpha-tubulin suppressor-like RCC1 family protein